MGRPSGTHEQESWHVRRLVERSAKAGGSIWTDMEEFKTDTNAQQDKYPNRHNAEHTHNYMTAGMRTDGETDRQTDTQIDRQTARQTDGRTNRQTPTDTPAG